MAANTSRARPAHPSTTAAHPTRARTAAGAGHAALGLREAVVGGRRLSAEALGKLLEVARVSAGVIADGKRMGRSLYLTGVDFGCARS